MSKKAVAANKILKKGIIFLMPAGTVASVNPLKEAQLLIILILEELSAETGRFNETLTALFTWHESKKASINAMHVTITLRVVCKRDWLIILSFCKDTPYLFFFSRRFVKYKTQVELFL